MVPDQIFDFIYGNYSTFSNLLGTKLCAHQVLIAEHTLGDNLFCAISSKLFYVHHKLISERKASIKFTGYKMIIPMLIYSFKPNRKFKMWQG